MGGPQWTDDDFQRARTEAARLLGFTNAENLSAADNLKVDLVTSLRAVVDDASASVLEGTQTDLGKLVIAVEHLTKLLPQNQEPASRGADPKQIMLETYLNMRRRGEIHFEKTERAQLLDKIAALEGEVAALKAGAPAPEEPSAPPPDNVVPLPRATAGKQNSAQAPPPPAAVSAPVAGELVMVVDPSSEEPWRDYVEPTGEIRSTPRGPGRYWGPV